MVPSRPALTPAPASGRLAGVQLQRRPGGRAVAGAGDVLGCVRRERVQREPLVRDQHRAQPAQLGSFDGDPSLRGAVAHDVDVVDVEVRGERCDAGDQCRGAEENLGPPTQAPGPGHGLSPAGAGAGSALLISKEFHFACSLRVLFAYLK